MTTFFNEAFEKLSDEDKASVAKDVEDAVKKLLNLLVGVFLMLNFL